MCKQNKTVILIFYSWTELIASPTSGYYMKLNSQAKPIFQTCSRFEGVIHNMDSVFMICPVTVSGHRYSHRYRYSLKLNGVFIFYAVGTEAL